MHSTVRGASNSARCLLRLQMLLRDWTTVSTHRRERERGDMRVIIILVEIHLHISVIGSIFYCIKPCSLASYDFSYCVLVLPSRLISSGPRSSPPATLI